MSGHSKWAQIKRQKGAADAKRGTLYTKLGHAIALATRDGGKDPNMNPRLRYAIDRAKDANMPQATIERAVKRGAGELDDGKRIERVVYEGYGPGGAAIIIEAATDNNNRTAADMRRLFSLYGGKLGTSGSVQWMFEARGIMVVATHHITDEQELSLIDAGAEDIDQGSEGVVVVTAADRLERVREAATASGLSVASAEVQLVATTPTAIADPRDAQRLREFLEKLEELDDVVTVTTNAEI